MNNDNSSHDAPDAGTPSIDAHQVQNEQSHTQADTHSTSHIDSDKTVDHAFQKEGEASQQNINPADVTATGDPNADVQHAVNHPPARADQQAHVHQTGNLQKVTNRDGDAVLSQKMVPQQEQAKPVEVSRPGLVLSRIEDEVVKLLKANKKPKMIHLGRAEMNEVTGNQPGQPDHQQIQVKELMTTHSGAVPVTAKDADSHFSVEAE